MPKSAISIYLQVLSANLGVGKASERTHYRALAGLIESLGTDVTAAVELKGEAVGIPDLHVSKGDVPLGWVEAKDIGKSLDEAERSSQLKRYFKLPNLILTDFLEFRWFTDGQHRATERLGNLTPEGKVKADKASQEAVEVLLRGFLEHPAPTVGTPKELAERMARLAQVMRDSIALTLEGEREHGALHAQLAAFQQALLPDLRPGEFADMFAQTLAYGLFAAKCNHLGGDFTRQTAPFDISRTNPFLRRLFQDFAGVELEEHPHLVRVVDDLVHLLNKADMGAILTDFARKTRQEDPVVYFYEGFLRAYDPRAREMRGVYYTPEPVVSYIVRSIDHLLRTEFGRPEGLADTNTLILDPACGTATFLFRVVKAIHQTLTARKQLGGWSDYAASHLLPRLFGFELLMAPYAVAHLKMETLLRDLGYEFASGQRLGIYLTNTLEEAVKRPEVLFATQIAEEGEAAAEIKRDRPIEVILGNPPYSGHSANKGKWIRGLIKDYKKVDGQPLGEKNPKWLQNDYVKFLRFGQWRIDRTGGGVLAMITDHGYLKNPTFRGVRQSLMESFSDIYLLDLHGGSKKRERAPGGGPDENVFDIQQGVAIGIFVKERGKSGLARVRHAELWGEREGKYEWLAAQDVGDTEWRELKPCSPSYLFVPADATLEGEYQAGWSVTNIFRLSSVGIATARDALTIGWSREELWARVRDFCSLDPEEARTKYSLGKDARDWQVSLAQQDLKGTGPRRELLAAILYRPFDARYTYYTGHSRGFLCRPRPEVMRHMLAGSNLALATTRSIEIGRGFEHVFCTRALLTHHSVSVKEVNYLYPLYLTPAEGEGKHVAKEPNLSKDFLRAITESLGYQPDPEDIFHYIYALLHSPTYRSRYAEFLKRDFPRIPLTSNRKLFQALAENGAELVALHLLESPALASGGPAFNVEVKDAGRVKQVRYDEARQRVYINREQFFEGVKPKVWAFHIGGYQVCQKWLKDRKGRPLSFKDVAHYQKVVRALEETIRLMGEIDGLVPGWPLP